MRFYALRLHEVGMLQSSPNALLAEGTDWRFLERAQARAEGVRQGRRVDQVSRAALEISEGSFWNQIIQWPGLLLAPPEPCAALGVVAGMERAKII